MTHEKKRIQPRIPVETIKRVKRAAADEEKSFEETVDWLLCSALAWLEEEKQGESE